MNNDSLATLLLCTTLGCNEEYPPFTNEEWQTVLTAIKNKGYTPRTLLKLDKNECLYRLELDPVLCQKLDARLKHIDKIFEKIAPLDCFDISVLTDEDIEYPVLIKKLCKNYPPLFYYAGNVLLANTCSCAILGSRTVSEQDIAVALKLAKRAVFNNETIITGGGSGIDFEVASYAFNNGGKVIEFCAGNLLKKLDNPLYRQQLKSGNLLILSEVTPFTDFSIKFALNRNKYIHCCANKSYVVKAIEEKSTFNGAKEALVLGLGDIYCFDNKDCDGNAKLIELGAFPFKET